MLSEKQETWTENSPVGGDVAAENEWLRARIADLEHQLKAPQSDQGAALDPEERTNDFASTIHGWFWETDASHRFIYLSPNVEQITGLSPEWHYGKTRGDLGCPDSISPDEWASHLECMNALQAFEDFVFRRRGPKGDTWLRTTGRPFFDADGVFCGYRGTAENVSEEIATRDRAIELASAVEEQNHILATTLRTIPDGVQVVDRSLKLVAYNDQLFEIMDLDKETIVNADEPGMAFLTELAKRGEYGEGDIDALVQSRLEIPRSGTPVHFERRLVTGKWIECRGTPIKGGSYLATYRDITDTRAMIDTLEEQASLDPLTGALNRRKFTDLAGEEFSRSRRYGRPLTFVVLDIDHFKTVNDTYGHAAGDECLRAVVRTCYQGLRDTDRLGRFGGEEFVLMLPETNVEGAEIVAERLRAAIEALTIASDDQQFHITASGGVAAAGFVHQTPDEVISQADAALYQAKRAGRNRVICAAE